MLMGIGEVSATLERYPPFHPAHGPNKTLDLTEFREQITGKYLAVLHRFAFQTYG